ncbi:MAG: arginase family protein [Pseudomonadota bacterium]
MQNRWILTPQFFEHPEPALSCAVPGNATQNGPHPISDRTAESIAKLHRPIAEFVEVTTRLGERPVSIAGDCCASIPVLAGLQRASIAPVLVWIDAHGDFNTPETSPSQFLGGMPLAMMVGRGPQWMCESLDMKTQPEHRVWLIDGRDLDPLERAAMDASAVRRTGIAGLDTLKIKGPVWVHLDVDVLDSDEVSAFKYPVSGGPSVDETIAACQGFANDNRIVAVSVSGWTGDLDEDGSTAEACNRVIGALVA